MKKLFKQLSIVLVLAMVIGLVPARQASAADYSVKLAHKYLFVGGAKGVDANGNLPANPIKKSYKVKINGLEKGDVVTLKSSDKTVAKAANNKYPQRVFAVAPGKAEFTVKVNGAEVGTLKVTVKQNATALEIVDLPENNQFGIGTYEVKVAATPAAATDVVKLVIADEYKDIAVVNEDGTITTKKPGSFKMSAVACQNVDTLSGATAKAEEVECTAAVKVVSATQKSQNEVNFVFDTAMTDIAAAKDFKVYYKVAGAEVVAATNKVVVDKDDATKVTLVLWSKLVEGTEYTVEYSGQKSTFTSAKMGAQYAASVRFNETKIVKSVVTEYDFTVLDANGVEMPESLNGYVTFEGVSTGKVQISGNAILFDEAGLTANVTATFEAWYDDATTGESKKNTFSNTALLTSVEATPVTITGYQWTIDDAVVYADFADPDFEPVQFVAANDYNVGFDKEFALKVKFSDGSALEYIGGTTVPHAAANGNNYAANVVIAGIDTADKNVAIVTNGIELQGVQAGTTQILVYAVGKTDAPILVVPFTVKAKAVLSTMTVDVVGGKTKLNTNTTGFNDTVSFKVVTKDQYGRPYDNATLSLDTASKSATAKIEAAPVAEGAPLYGKKTITVTAGTEVAAAAEGVVVLKITAADDNSTAKLVNTAKSITCKNCTDSFNTLTAALAVAASTKLVVASGLDQSVGGTLRTLGYLDDADTTVKVAPFDKNGYQIAAADNATYAPSTDYATAASAYYVFRAFAGATELREGVQANDIIGNGYLSSVGTDLNTANKLVKLNTKSIIVKLYKVSADAKSAVCTDTATIAVADSQPTLSFAKVEDSISEAGSVANCFELYYDGDDYAVDANHLAPVFATVTGQGTFVKSVTVKVSEDGTNFFDITLPIGLTLED